SDLVGDLGELGQDLGDVDARGLGWDGLENAADLVGHVVLGVPEVEMAGASLEIDHDDALGLAPAGTADRLGGAPGSFGRVSLAETEQVGERQADHGRAADAEQIATCQTIAGVFAGPLGKNEHHYLLGWSWQDGEAGTRCVAHPVLTLGTHNSLITPFSRRI